MKFINLNEATINYMLEKSLKMRYLLKINFRNNIKISPFRSNLTKRILERDY